MTKCLYDFFFLCSLASWIIISSICAVALSLLTEFYSIVIAFVIFLSSSLCAAIVSAISVSLYPTNIRAMATCFIFMFGRIGGLAGGNLVGVLVENNCNLIFNVFAGLSFSKSCSYNLYVSIKFSPFYHHLINIFTVCAFVFLSIKKEVPTPTIQPNDQTNDCSA